MTRRARAVALTALVLVAIAVLELPDRDPAPRGAPTARATPTATATPPGPPPRASRAQINAQDRLTHAQRTREQRQVAARRLLDHLPLELAGVRIDVAGIAPDRRRTLLELRPGSRGRDFALDLYRQALATYGDSGRAYQPHLVP